MTDRRDEDSLLNSERGLPSVNQKSSDFWRRGLVAIFVGGMILAFFCYLYINHTKSQSSERSENITKQKDIQITNAVPTRTFELPANSGNNNTGARSSMFSENPVDKSSATLMISTDNNATFEKPAASPTLELDGQNRGGRLSGMLNSTATTPTSAKMLKDRDYLLAKGSFINCGLRTRLDTTVAGMLHCIVSSNVYSDTGKVLLVERGSTVSGEYQSDLKQGQKRIFVIWNRIKTPNGVVINIDSPGTDPLGGSGIPGYVDEHFAQRYSGAILLSFIQDFSAAAANSLNRQNNVYTFNNTASASQTLATEALRSTINIPPTLYNNQGGDVAIYVSRDLDFRTVYDLKHK